MNTSALKSFAPAVRRELIEAVGRKLDVVLATQTPDYRTTFAAQVATLRKLERADRTGLVEKVAYTWFNRLTALRYLDARGWHPFRARVLTLSDEGSTQPELLKLARDGALPDELKRHTDSARLDGLLDGKLPSSNPQGEVYRHLVLASCRFYHTLLPDVFERLDDATELLLPDDLLTEQSVVQGFRTEITDEDCADVEIIGWLYQFYLAERKDEIMARKSSVPTEDIPAVTQLFTPHWIVRYLVENSLGRLWLLNHPDSRLREHMPYYIESEPETDFLKITKPEDIRVCDPAVGSGHMLTYAFDLLTLIYEEEGYAPTEVPALILRHNLFGIDIDARAAQLAELALVFKAREKSRRFFQPDHLVRPNIVELRDVRFADNELREYIRALDLGALFDASLIELLHQFEEARNFGSLIQPCLDERAIAFARRAIEAKDLGGQLFLSETHLKVLRVLEQAQALTQRYYVVVVNPPYMGGKGMNPRVKQFLQEHFADFKADMFAGFIVRSLGLAVPSGQLGFMTPFVWMFISTYEKLRQHILGKATITSLVQLEYSGFDGATVPICTFTLENRRRATGTGYYVRLTSFRGTDNQGPKTIEAVKNRSCGWFYEANSDDFMAIPGSPIAYWASKAVFRSFKSATRSVANFVESEGKNVTTDNARFTRCWWEIDVGELGESPKRWFPFATGGGFRKWFGNMTDVVDWSPKALQHYRQSLAGRLIREEFWFLRGITWSKITSSRASFRILPREQTYQEVAILVRPRE